MKARKILSKIKSLLYQLLYLIFDLLLMTTGRLMHKCLTNNFLIIRPDNIGDYILFRNFLPFIRKSLKYRNIKITLLGNSTYRTLAETLDSEYIDKFIWINSDKYFEKSILGFIFTIKINWQLCKTNYNQIFYPAFSRTQKFDKLIKKLSAKEKITCSGDKVNKNNEIDITGNVYSLIILSSPQYGLFEFERNKETVSKLLCEEINLKYPIIEKLPENSKWSLPYKYIAICMEASSANKRWQEEYFYIIISYILNIKNIHVVLLGLEFQQNTQWKYNSLNTKVFDLREKTTLLEAASILGKAICYIGNDSALIHLAAAAGIKKMIVVCYGAYYGRFTPYPSMNGRDYRFIFPPEIQININDSEYLKKKYANGLSEDINLITPQNVIDVLDKLI